jgi:exodeoxyribonuclease-5
MNKEHLYNLLISKFPYAPTEGQKTLLQKLSAFILQKDDRSMFVLKGYAGTGKTTVISTLVKTLPILNKNTELLAPTGRAAKVLSAYSGKQAFTIHKKIYMVSTGLDGALRFGLAYNPHKNTLFFVDEASMIPDNSVSEGFFPGADLLRDLMQYVHSGTNNKLILIGDTAQLPPVGLDISPALDLGYLRNTFSLSIHQDELKEVVRQSLDSGILANATRIRNNLDTEGLEALLHTDGFDDIERITGEMLEEELNHSFYGHELGRSVVVTRSNKRANIFNREIRNRILFREHEIATGDLLMVVKNNYFWVSQDSKPGFIANGDIVEIVKILGYEELYGFRFAEVVVNMADYPDEPDLTVKVILDSLASDGPSLSKQDNQTFFEEVMKDYEDEPHRRKRIEGVKNNPHFNALQVKFAYALTCHKTQGGQWENVFIDVGYLKEEYVNKSFYRWLYTAMTRATKKLYLVNFPEPLFNA